MRQAVGDRIVCSSIGTPRIIVWPRGAHDGQDPTWGSCSGGKLQSSMSGAEGAVRWELEPGVDAASDALGLGFFLAPLVAVGVVVDRFPMISAAR